MYHIVNTKSRLRPFQVVNVDSGNGEVINQSQPLTTKQNCIKNIVANMDTVFSDDNADRYVLMQDDTGKVPVAFKLYDDKRKEKLLGGERPKYVPGKNKKPAKQKTTPFTGSYKPKLKKK